MKSKTRFQSLAFLFSVFVLGLLIIILAHSAQGSSQFMASTNTPTPATKQPEAVMREPTAFATVETPEFISGLFPHPGETLSVEEYNQRGGEIVIKIWPDKIGITGYYPNALKYMMTLYMDGALIPQDTFRAGQLLSEPGTFEPENRLLLIWSLDVDPGEHSAKLRILKGKDLIDYEWSFTIIE